MSIWTNPKSIEQLNQLSRGSFQDHLNIKVTEIGDNYLVTTMEVTPLVLQPHGVLHGGASVVLAETTGSLGSEMCISAIQACVGLEVNANHVRSVRTGILSCRAENSHLGRTTHIWSINITNGDNKLVCTSRLTMAIVNKNQW